jgi:hypothetical protein
MSAARAALLLFVLAAGCNSAARRGPRRLPWLGIDLPASTREYHVHEKGLNATMLQARFDVDPADLPAVERELCAFGAPTTAKTGVASVGTNDRDWYTPEAAATHRDCHAMVKRPGLTKLSVSMLADVSDASRVRVYLVASD